MANAHMTAFTNRLRGRYAPTVDAYSTNLSKMNSLLDQRSQQGIADINSRFNMLGQQQQAGLVNRGLGNTTIGGTMQQGLERQRMGAINTHNDSILQQRLATEAMFRMPQMQLMQRQQDADWEEQERQRQAQARMPYWTDRSGAKHMGYYGG